MSDSNWSVRVAIVGCSAIILLIVWGLAACIYYMGQASALHQAEANRYTAEYPADTDKRLEKCLVDGFGPDAKKCVEEAIASSHEAQRSEQDLQAQRDMSEWAWWLLIVSLGQVPIGLGGLFVLLVTIKQGREANNIAQRSVRYQIRPWVGVVLDPKLSNHQLSISKESASLSVALLFQNHGQSPAADVRYAAVLYLDPVTSEEVEQEIGIALRKGAMDGGKTVLFPTEDWEVMPDAEVTNHGRDAANMILAVAVVYRTPGQREFHTTIRTFRVYCSQAPHEGWGICLASEVNCTTISRCMLVSNSDDAGIVT